MNHSPMLKPTFYYYIIPKFHSQFNFASCPKTDKKIFLLQHSVSFTYSWDPNKRSGPIIKTVIKNARGHAYSRGLFNRQEISYRQKMIILIFLPIFLLFL